MSVQRPAGWVRETLGMGQVHFRLGSEAGIAHPPWAPLGVGLGLGRLRLTLQVMRTGCWEPGPTCKQPGLLDGQQGAWCGHP